MTTNNRNDHTRVFVGTAIRAPKVLCIDDESKNLGIISISEALRLASEKELDLVQIAPPLNGRPPTCKILDYGKYKYDQSKKVKAAEKKQRESEIKLKEIKFRPVTDSNDLMIKAKKAQEFLTEGSRLKVTIMFRGREFSHKEVAFQTLNEFLLMLPGAGVVGSPSSEGSKALTVMVELKNEEAKRAS